MARKASKHPTELELEILQIIWRNGPATVREICTALEPQRPLAFTSVLTIMNIMVKKGYLASEKRSRAEGGNIYKATVAKSQTAFTMFESLARRFFGGSLAGAIQNLIRAGEISRSEMAHLRKLMNQNTKDRRQ